MNNNKISISLTGHRPSKLGNNYDMNSAPWQAMKTDLEIYIERNLEVYQTVVCHSGLALGADTIWSMAILSVRERFPGRVKFHADIPMMEQATPWKHSPKSVAFWNKQVETADSQTVYGSLANLPEGPKRIREAARLMNVRNHGMLGATDLVLALYDGTPGGTGNAIAFAEKKKIPVIAIHPDVYFG